MPPTVLASLLLLACPLCDSPTADHVRAELMGPNLLTPASALGLPFLACLGVAALVRYLPRREERR